VKIDRVAVEEYMNPHGIYAAPRLRVDIDVQSLPKGDEFVQMNDGAIAVRGFKYSFLADLYVVGVESGVGADLVNSHFPGAPWFPVVVNFHEPTWQWYLPLDRARKELGKYQRDWTITVDEDFAKQGKIVWRLREKNLLCKARDEHARAGDYPFCNAPAVTEIRRQGYYIPLCTVHHQRLTADTIRKRGQRR
jgi:hypothetical protein